MPLYLVIKMHIEFEGKMDSIDMGVQSVCPSATVPTDGHEVSLKGKGVQWFPTLVLGTPCPACFRFFPAPTHLLQMYGSLSSSAEA